MGTPAEQYAALKGRVGKLEATKQFWEGKKESHDKSTKFLLETVTKMVSPVENLKDAREVLSKLVAADLEKLETAVAAAEGQFKTLRSQDVTEA